MAKQPGVWGIDLGQCALKALRIEEQDGKVVATAFDYVEHPKILSQPDADPDQLIREALNKFLERNKLRGDIVAIGVPGQSGLARFVKLPPVEEKKIGDIVKFEAKQQIPFNLDEVVWDYQKLSAGMVTDGFALDTEIGLFAMKRDMVNRYLDHFKEVKVEVHVVQMAPLALCNYVSYDLLNKRPNVPEEAAVGKKKCVVALDIGADSSNLVITDGGRIIWQRPIPLGGNHFTRALTKDLKLTFAKAEHLKRNATKSPDLKKILAALKPVLTDFVGEVQRSLGFFTNSHRDATIEYMVGLGNAFRLPGLQRYMAEKLQLDVRKVAKLEHLEGDAVVNESIFQENILSFPVCYGLALQGLKHSRLQTNLLPPELRTERLIRAKKPWAVAAAAAILLGSSVALWGGGRQWIAYGHPDVATAKEGGKSVLGKVSQAKSAYNSQKSATEAEKSGIESVVAGQPERENFLKLQQFVGQVVPRPEHCTDFRVNPYGSFIPDVKAMDPNIFRAIDAELRLWNREGHTAVILRSQAEGTKGRQPGQTGPATTVSLADDPTLKLEDLVQFNLVGMDCRYTDDLSSFWKALPDAARDRKNQQVRPTLDYDTPPAQGEKGWVVELRGYTYHKKKTEIVKHVLLERIAQLGAKTPPTPPPGAAAPGTEAAQPADPGTQPADAGQRKPRSVSHVVLYDVLPVDNQGSEFTALQINGGKGALSTLKLDGGGGGGAAVPGGDMGGGGSPPDGMGSGGQPASQGGGRSSWAPLGQASGNQQGGPMEGPMGSPGPTVPAPGAPGSGGPGIPMGGPGPTPQGPGKGLTRTEFIVLFIWREPTPSDNSLAFPGAAAPE